MDTLTDGAPVLDTLSALRSELRDVKAHRDELQAVVNELVKTGRVTAATMDKAASLYSTQG
jgi:hypothetical protein